MIVWLSLRKLTDSRLFLVDNKSSLTNNYRQMSLYTYSDGCLVKEQVGKSEVLCNAQPQWISEMKSTTITCIAAAMHSCGFHLAYSSRLCITKHLPFTYCFLPYFPFPLTHAWLRIATPFTVAQKTAPMFACYIKTHVLLNADII